MEWILFMDLLVWDQLWKDGRCTTSVSTESGMDPNLRRQQMELLFNGLMIKQSRWYAVYGTSRFKLKEDGVKPYDLLTTIYIKIYYMLYISENSILWFMS